jgi:hypothetical protein
MCLTVTFNTVLLLCFIWIVVASHGRAAGLHGIVTGTTDGLQLVHVLLCDYRGACSQIYSEHVENKMESPYILRCVFVYDPNVHENSTFSIKLVGI